MKIRYKYLFRLIAVAVLVLLIPMLLFISFFWKKSFDEMKEGNDAYYEKMAASFSNQFSRTVMSLKDHASQISVASKNQGSVFYEGEEAFARNLYWYYEGVDEMKREYSDFNASECGIYYYALDSVITRTSSLTLEQYLSAIRLTEGEQASARAFFDGENYRMMSLRFATTNTEENAGGDMLVGYCTTLGRNQDKVMIFYRLRPADMGDMLASGFEDGICFYVLSADTGELLLAMGDGAAGLAVREEGDGAAGLAVREEGDGEAGLAAREDVDSAASLLPEASAIYSRESSVLPLRYVTAVTEDSRQSSVTLFYQDMRRMTVFMMVGMVFICIMALYLEYKPVKRLVAEMEGEGTDEFDVIRNTLNERHTRILEQELLIIDLLVNHLIHGMQIQKERLEKLGVDASMDHYRVFLLEGKMLLSGEVEQLSRRVERDGQARLFVTDLQGEEMNVIIAFQKGAGGSVEEEIRSWMKEYLGLGCSLLAGRLVERLDDIKISFQSCLEQKDKEEAKELIEELKSTGGKNEKQKQLKKDVLAYLEIHYRDPDLSQVQVADAFQISSYTLCRMFKKQVGVGYTDYVNSKRLEYAKELLLTTDYSVREIAVAVGFANENYFSRIFKTMVGVTPTAFREEAAEG